MSREDDREGPDPRRSTGGGSVLLVLLLVGGFVALLLVLVVVGAGFFFMARTAEHAEMQAVVMEERAMAAEQMAEADKQKAAVTRIYTREDFKTVVTGKTEQAVEDALGKPTRIVQDETITYWEYDQRTFDPATGATDPTVKLTFKFGRVTDITY